MATFDYRCLATGEIREIIRMPGETAPDTDAIDGMIWERLPAAPRIVTADTRGFKQMPNEKALARRGSTVIEPGMDKDVEYNKKQVMKKQDAAMEEHVIASVNRAMP
jgi:hypothetical protein